MGVNLSFDKPGGFSSQIGEEGFEDLLVALGFEHDGAVGFVADPPGDGVASRDQGGPGAESNALDSSLEDDALTGDHEGIVEHFGGVMRSRTLLGPIRRGKSRLTDDPGGELGFCWHG